MRISLGEFGTIEVADDRLIAGRRAAVAPDLPDLRAAVRQALEQPRNFPPLRRALTPDDRVAIIVDEQLPQLGVCLGEILTYLSESGIDPSAVTLVSPRGSKQGWIDDLPDSLHAARTEVHDPSNRRSLCYLASTRGGRRIYLNRTVVEADVSIVLTGCRYDPSCGIHSATTTLYPALSDDMTQADGGSRSVAEAAEVAWLLGVPFLVQVIEGNGEQAAHVVGGTIETAEESAQLLQARWRVCYDRPAEVVVATMTGDPRRHDLAAVARAAQNAAAVCEAGGKVILLTQSEPEFGPLLDVSRQAENAAAAVRQLQQRRPEGHEAALHWLEAVRHASVYFLSRLDENLVEDVFATPLTHAGQAQRLVSAARSCLILDDAHKALAVID